ncbi:MAG: hypothetical protein HQ523_03585 [Lentisphaerae bacterium]|nr:hypothetical protein [Lentisphaerota bacterium]
MKKRLVASMVVVLALSALNGVAALITGVTATASSTYSSRVAANIVNYSGLSVPVDAFTNAGVSHGATSTTMWLSTGDGFGGVDPSPSVTFDLGMVHTVSNMHVWNYNEGGSANTRGVQGLTVLSSELGSPTESQGAQTLAQAAGAPYEGELVAFAEPFRARYIKFAITSNHGDASTFYGLSEVQFDGVPVDPATLPSLITGVTATASSTYSTRVAANIVNYSGLSIPVDSFSNAGVTHVYSNASSTMWLSTGDNGFGGIDPSPSVAFDLGDLYYVFEMHVWNYDEFGQLDRGVKDLDLWSSESGTPNVSQGAYTFGVASNAPGAPSYLGELFTFVAPLRARYISFAITSHHGNADSFYGLSEVQFSGRLVPPEGTLISIR